MPSLCLANLDSIIEESSIGAIRAHHIITWGTKHDDLYASMQKSSHSDIETKIKHIYDALISCDSAHTSLSLTAFDELILIKVLYIIRTKFHRKHQNVWGNPNKFSIIDPAIFVESCRGNLHGVSQKMADQFTRMCNGLEFHTRYSSPDMWAVLYPELNLRFGVFGDFFPWFEPS